MQPAGICIFCGNTGVTKEHLFSDWLSEYFPRTDKQTHTHGKTEPWPEFQLRTKQGHSGSRQVRKVCKQCNGVWISQIDNAAKTVAVPIFKGEATTVTQEQQSILAAWFAKIAMVGDAMDHEKSILPQADRDYIMASSKAPPLWQMWIGSAPATEWIELAIFQNRGKLNGLPIDPSISYSYAQSTVLGIGKMIVLLMAHDVPVWKFEIGANPAKLAQIWPVSSTFEWPMPSVLSDDDACDLVEVLKTSKFITREQQEHSAEPPQSA